MESYDINNSQVEGIDKVNTNLTIGKAALVHSIIQESSLIYERKALKTSIPKNIRQKLRLLSTKAETLPSQCRSSHLAKPTSGFGCHPQLHPPFSQPNRLFGRCCQCR